MSVSHGLVITVLSGVVGAGLACSDKAVDETKRDARSAIEATRAGADKAIDATKKVGDQTADIAKDVALQAADRTTEIAGDLAEKSQQAVSATGAAVTDGWITTKVKAKFADETALNGSEINVQTKEHVVTLRGTVFSDAAKARAAVIASGTEGVARVVNQLIVK
jgi:hyperosmotically inducible periplasmic protein